MFLFLFWFVGLIGCDLLIPGLEQVADQLQPAHEAAHHVARVLGVANAGGERPGGRSLGRVQWQELYSSVLLPSNGCVGPNSISVKSIFHCRSVCVVPSNRNGYIASFIKKETATDTASLPILYSLDVNQ